MKNKLILGTVQFGLNYGINNQSGQIKPEHAFEILDYAYENGVRYLDTASAYGMSEKIIGQYFQSRKGNPFQVITKLQSPTRQSPLGSLKESLYQLSIDKVDTLMFHSYADYELMREDLPLFIQDYKGVLFDSLGVSLYTNEEIEKVASDSNIELVQMPYNLLDNQRVRGKSLELLKQQGKKTHVRSVFLQGLFFMNTSSFPDNLVALTEPVKKLLAISQSTGMSIETLALNYVLSNKNIDAVLLGVDSLSHLQKNIENIATPIAPEIIQEIESISNFDLQLLNPTKWNIKK